MGLIGRGEIKLMTLAMEASANAPVKVLGTTCQGW